MSGLPAALARQSALIEGRRSDNEDRVTVQVYVRRITPRSVTLNLLPDPELSQRPSPSDFWLPRQHITPEVEAEGGMFEGLPGPHEISIPRWLAIDRGLA